MDDKELKEITTDIKDSDLSKEAEKEFSNGKGDDEDE